MVFKLLDSTFHGDTDHRKRRQTGHKGEQSETKQKNQGV